MRVKRILIAAAVVATVAGACGGDKPTPLETVQAASAQTFESKTASIAMTVNGGSGALKNITMNGEYDFEHKLMAFEMDAAKLGLPGASGTVSAVMDFSDSVVQYMKLPGLEQETGKSWMKIDVSQGIKALCPDLDFAALLQSQSGDPTSGLDTLKFAKSVKEIGTEKVRGEETTHYQVTVDVRDAAEHASAEARATMREFASWYINPVQTSEVWIDGEGRARKSEIVSDAANLKLPACMSASQAQNPFQGKTTMSFELFDFGKKVDIKVPAGGDVLDLADLQE